ncbi:hypothetical protein [Crassaminicella profunda]|uniref:hypothetical protein n=1 Tax=Crassaminicella profunda TaxID=1286698 RepID=UPI001CA6B3DF|nr:hypothetical protein [Crassaminicella profunda]QZY54670.1 hypothetical protein K7H06_16760 [Crassaminicella profunda]
MKITKKMYEEYLNELGVPENEKFENGGNYRGKKYGSWLRRNDKAAFDIGYNQYVVIKNISYILKEEHIEKECHVLTPIECSYNNYQGRPPLLMITSELESTFIAEFIDEWIPKDKYLLKPCSNYCLGVYPRKSQEQFITRLMVG